MKEYQAELRNVGFDVPDKGAKFIWVQFTIIGEKDGDMIRSYDPDDRKSDSLRVYVSKRDGSTSAGQQKMCRLKLQALGHEGKVSEFLTNFKRGHTFTIYATTKDNGYPDYDLLGPNGGGKVVSKSDVDALASLFGETVSAPPVDAEAERAWAQAELEAFDEMPL